MKVELEIISDIYSNPDKRGNRKILFKDKLIRKVFEVEEIRIEEFIDIRSGRIIKKYSAVVEKDTYYKVNKPYNALKDIICNKVNPVLGFMGHSKSKYNGI